MTIESEHDLEHLKRVGKIVAVILNQLIKRTEAGMSTADIDTVAKQLFEYHDVRSAPMLSYNFPGYTCISVNEEAAHGIPGDRIIQPGDLVNIDVSAELNGYFADTGGSFVVPPASAEKTRICSATKLALNKAIAKSRCGMPLNIIGKTIQKVAKDKGYKTIRNLTSHGVGRALHEEPSGICNYYNPKDKRILKEGMVITIEPFLSSKSSSVSQLDDGWTLVGQRGNLSAQYEHTMVITKGTPILLTVA